MKSIEATGKTVKEAVAKACTELGCDQSDVDIQVLEIGSPGLFGLFGKPAKVRVTAKNLKEEIDLDIPKLSLDPSSPKKQEKPRAEKKSEKKPEKKTEKKPEKKPEAKPEADVQDEQPEAAVAAEDVQEQADGEATQSRSRSRRRRSRSRKGSAERVEEPAAEPEVVTVPAPLPEPEPFVETPEEELTEDAKKARAFLKGLTDHMNVPADITVCQTEENVRMVLAGENMSILIGRRGETLDALQYLTSLHVNRSREEYLRVSLDTENYRAKREEALRKLAVRMANRCKKTGRRVALEPMNPYERRILHSALQADPEVTTHSEGEEPYRKVIITLK